MNKIVINSFIVMSLVAHSTFKLDLETHTQELCSIISNSKWEIKTLVRHLAGVSSDIEF